MSPRDLTAELRGAATPVPPALRERVRLIAAAEPASPRPPRLTPPLARRRALLVAVPVAAAAAAAGIVLTRPQHRTPTAEPPRVAVQHGESFRAAGAAGERTAAPANVAPSRKRLQDYSATLELRAASRHALSNDVQRAQRIVGSLSGYAQSVDVADGSARLVLKVPRIHVQAALTRLAALGTILGETVDLRDLQAGVGATDRTIARLQRQLKQLRTEDPRSARKIAAVTARVEALQRRQAATRRAAHDATVELRLTTRKAAVVPTPTRHGPLHGLVVAFRWVGIGLVYALAFGAPLAALWLLARHVRQRREDALLGR